MKKLNKTLRSQALTAKCFNLAKKALPLGLLLKYIIFNLKVVFCLFLYYVFAMFMY